MASSEHAADEAAIRAIPLRMVNAWNEGRAEGFAAPFGESADFVAFEGTHLEGRKEIVSFHEQIFTTTVKGSRLEQEVRFVHYAFRRPRDVARGIRTLTVA